VDPAFNAWLAVLITWVFAWVWTGIIARRKSRSVFWWVVLALPFGIFATLTVLALETLPDEAAREREAASLRACPYCLAHIPKRARACRYCGHDVDPVVSLSAKDAFAAAAREDIQQRARDGETRQQRGLTVAEWEEQQRRLAEQERIVAERRAAHHQTAEQAPPPSGDSA